jgi:hypothetical protein
MRASETMMQINESFATWGKDPKYVEAYDAFDDEFSLAAPIIQAAAPARSEQESGQ